MNRNRFHILVSNYLNSFGSEAQILSPEIVNKAEPVFFNCPRYFKTIKIGCSLSYFSDLNALALEKFSRENFLIKFDLTSNTNKCSYF